METDRFSIQARDEALKTRCVSIKSMQASVDRAYQSAQTSSSSCFDMRCVRWILRRWTAGEATEMQAVAQEAPARSTGAFFKKGLSPAKKLEMAKDAMAERANKLHEKVAAHRAEAKRMMDAGDKQSALRAMRKAKQYEQRAAEAVAASDGLERQIDLLEQAALQSDVAKALGTTAKQAAKAKGLLSKAEAGVEGAAELRDTVDDINVVLGESNGASADYDDDDLLAELEQMTEQSVADISAPARDPAPAVSFPSVPRSNTANPDKKLERVALMQAQ